MYVSDPLASLESTNGRVGLHVSFIAKTHFCHAPESHACLSEVGKTRQQQSINQKPLAYQLALCIKYEYLRADLLARHRFTCIRFSVVCSC